MTAAPDPPRVVLLTRPGCHLCEAARAVVGRVTTELATSYVERDITTDPALLAEFGDWIPVTLVDGRQLDYWRVDEGRLRAALATPPAGRTTPAGA